MSLNPKPTTFIDCVHLSWIENETGGAEINILDSDPPSESRLVVASFVNFQPMWLHPFDPEETSQNGLFYLPGGER